VSFIIPTHNYGPYVLEAIASALAQTYDNYELIVVDDGSTDNTRQLIEPLRDRLRYLWRSQGGPSAARNTGIRASRGELIAFLDADDLWLPHKTAAQVSYLGQHPTVGLVCARTAAMDRIAPDVDSPLAVERCRSGEVLTLEAGAAFAKLLLEQRNPIATSTVMLRRRCLERVGMFDESLMRVEDFNLWLRIGRHFALSRLPEVQSLHRHHDANLARSREAMRVATIASLDRICALYPEAARLRDRVVAGLYYRRGLQDLLERRPREARANFGRTIRHRALTIPAYPLLAVCCCPPSWLDAARAVVRAGRKSVTRPARRGAEHAKPGLKPGPAAAAAATPVRSKPV
jgi:glycosyltransferase involved in cell wall biosynthesis